MYILVDVNLCVWVCVGGKMTEDDKGGAGVILGQQFYF